MAEELKTEELKAEGTPKSGVLSIAIKERAALYAAYMPFVTNGGLFIPTTKTFKIGEEVFILLSLIDEQEKMKVAGHVVWVNPARQGNKPQGIGVQFDEKHGGKEARQKIEVLLGSALKSSRSTYTM